MITTMPCSESNFRSGNNKKSLTNTAMLSKAEVAVEKEIHAINMKQVIIMKAIKSAVELFGEGGGGGVKRAGILN